MKILILSPHPDDCEGCMGATISRLTDDNKVRVMFFSDCDIPNAAGEIAGSMAALGVKKWDLLDYPRRRMDDFRHKLRDMLFRMKAEGFDVVYCPHPADHHQDHKLIAELATSVFGSDTDLIYYLWPKNGNYNPTYFVSVTDEQLKDKLAALMCYRSQVAARPAWFNEQTFRAMAVFYGLQAGCVYAEAFEPYRIRK